MKIANHMFLNWDVSSQFCCNASLSSLLILRINLHSAEIFRNTPQQDKIQIVTTTTSKFFKTSFGVKQRWSKFRHIGQKYLLLFRLRLATTLERIFLIWLLLILSLSLSFFWVELNFLKKKIKKGFACLSRFCST